MELYNKTSLENQELMKKAAVEKNNQNINVQSKLIKNDHEEMNTFYFQTIH